MTNAELAAALNDEFGLEGRARLSTNVIRQWVEWGLLPKAQVAGRVEGGGPIWERNDSAMVRARRFAKMRVFGIRSERALLAQAYIEWDAVSFDRARPAIIGEFRSVRSKLWRTMTADIPAGPVSEFSKTKRRALIKQSGPLDPVFHSTQFELPTDTILTAMQSAFAGQSNETEQIALFANVMAQMAPSIATHIPTPLPAWVNLNGLFAPSDEIDFSGEAVLEMSNQSQFDKARKTTMQFVRRSRQLTNSRYSGIFPSDSEALRFMIGNLLPQISSGPWLIAGFVQILMAQKSKNIAD